MQNLLNKIHLGDCLDFMRELPDKCVDLVLTDPPYGIGASGKHMRNGTSKLKKEYYTDDKKWDEFVPDKSYFDEISRISKNQIIWGGNYFSLPPSRCFYVWDKTIHGNSYADCELAWTSYDRVARIKSINMVEASLDGRVHPTQKPLKLFKWCLAQAKLEKGTVLDCFSGSGTTALACHDLGLDFICIEKDPDYHAASVKRLEEHQRQGKLF